MQLGRGRALERGDTIIEVIFAIVIFAMVIVSSLAIMNRGIATGERALEVTLVRQQINAQAEALRFVHEARVVSPESAYAATWRSLIDTFGQESASKYGVSGTSCVLPEGSSYHPFIMNAKTAKVWSSPPTIEPAKDANVPPYPQVVYSKSDPTAIDAAYGLWVEAVPSNVPTEGNFVDFHIRACWPGPGSPIPMTIGTIVRLYDPL